MTTQTSRLEGLTTAVAIKAPCKATSGSNLTLNGEQTIDGVSCVSGDRVLVRAQTDATNNGIYIVSTSDWQRADDFNGARDVVQGTEVRVTQGNSFSGRYYVTSSNPIMLDTSTINFTFVPATSITSLSQLTGDSDDVAQGSSNLYMTLSERSKLAGIEPLADVNVQPDWNETVSGSDAFILNKPTIGTMATQDANDVTITGGNATGLTDVSTTDLQAATSAGLNFKTNGGATAFSYGGGGSTTLVLSGSLSLNSIAYSGATGVDTTLVSGTAGTSGNLAQWNTDGDVVDSSIASANVLVDADVGVTVQAYDADTLKADVTDTLTVGYATTTYNAGTQSSGTFTPNEANGNFQRIVNGGAFTLAPPTNDTAITIQMTNNSTAGALTTSGFTVVTGDTLTTVDGDDFILDVRKINGFSQLHVVALQ